jgi:DNA phosphorothioation-associated putative methyltransferase
MAIVHRHRAAISRHELSRPIRLALEDEIISTDTTVFDYGCGRGDDLRLLRQRQIKCDGWDPAYRPKSRNVAAEIVNLGYVINVIEDESERAGALKQSWALTERVLIVSARLTSEASLGTQTQFEDGCLTKLGTFQKYFEQHELREWIDRQLGVPCVAAGPGVFYVFRQDTAKQTFLAARYRRRVEQPRLRRTEVLYEQHREILRPLSTFVSMRGRLPDETELSKAENIRRVFGSLRRAFEVVRRATDSGYWTQVRDDRAQDLLVYLALARFSGRPIFSKLPHDIQLDVRAFFSTYTQACADADRALFAVGSMQLIDKACCDSRVGKLTPNALYVHRTGLQHLPSLLRVYEGCGRTFTGEVEAANLIKLNRHKPQISYLSYPTFDGDPHPALAASLIVNLRTFRLRYVEYRDSENPPILHRKESFVPETYPGRSKFAALTRREERLGLYTQLESIGVHENWKRLLAEKNLYFRGHQLIARRTDTSRSIRGTLRHGDLA